MTGDDDGEGREQRSHRSARGRVRLPLAVVLGLPALALALALAYGSLPSLAHVGWDTYPMIASSRVDGIADTVALFGRELMDGRYPGGRFYRPLTTLSFALDGEMWGQDPRGYHSTDLVILAALTGSVFALAARLLGLGAALVAAAIVALHPLQIEVVPVSARRADTLCTLFAVLAVLASLRRDRSAFLARSSLWAALASGLALASKETGAVALPAAVAARALLAHAGAPRERLAAVARWSAAPLGAVALFVGARSVVLGGLGGHPDSSLLLAPLRAASAAASAATALVHPQPFFADPRLDTVWQAAALLGLAGLVPLAVLQPSLAVLQPSDAVLQSSDGKGEPAGRAALRLRVLLLVGAWGVGLALLTGLSGRFEPWYAGPYVAPFALAIAVGVDAFAGSLRRRDGLRIAGGTAALALALAGFVRYTPLVHSYREWERLHVRETRFLDDFRSQLVGLEPGIGVVVRGLPMWEEPEGPVGVRGASGLAQYSVQAFADLQPSAYPIRVSQTNGTRVPISQPGTLQVDIVADEDAIPSRAPFATLSPR